MTYLQFEKYDAITVHVYGNIGRGVFSNHDLDEPVRWIDLLGCERAATPDQGGMTRIPVTSAPLLIKAIDVETLSNALKQAKDVF